MDSGLEGLNDKLSIQDLEKGFRSSFLLETTLLPAPLELCPTNNPLFDPGSAALLFNSDFAPSFTGKISSYRRPYSKLKKIFFSIQLLLFSNSRRSGSRRGGALDPQRDWYPGHPQLCRLRRACCRSK
jgi:hypothetical protein